MGIKDKELIEERFGRLWSGKETVTIGDTLVSMRDLKRAFNILADDVVEIDITELGTEHWAFRYYDGDDRCITVLEFDGVYHVKAEHRAHIAEWLGQTYHESGILAYLSTALLSMLKEQYLTEEEKKGDK